MKWLVTGANGFLGRHVVHRFLEQGAEIRALVRPSAQLNGLPLRDRVERFHGDLRRCPNLTEAFDGVDGLVHLAAAVSGSPEEQFSSTVVATEKLLSAMATSHARRLVFISSFSVYDWGGVRRKFDETTPLESSRLYERDGYAVAKTWQEKVVRQFAERQRWDLTVLRPGFIWGRGNEWCVGLGDKIGKRHVIIGPMRNLPLTHASNCADCIVVAASHDAAIGETFNVVDDDTPNAWRFAGDYLSNFGDGGYRIPIPYHLGLTASIAAKTLSRMCFGNSGKLPGLFVPRRFVARFKSAKFSNAHLKRTLGWQPPLSYAECLRQTYAVTEPESPQRLMMAETVHA